MFIFLSVFLISFGVYLFTLCPSLSVGDSGEFITACSTLSLAHPPGYPLYALLGKIFCILIPWGNTAYRVNLFSAFFAAASAGIMTKIILVSLNGPLTLTLSPKGRGEGEGKFFAVAGGLILAFFPTFWSQALVSEVFALNTFLAVLIIFVIIVVRGTVVGRASQPNLVNRLEACPTSLYLLSFLFGLGLGNHHTLVLLLPAILYWTVGIIARRTKQSLLGFAMTCLFFFLIGFSIYLYLPIRAALEPPLNFGQPDNWERFWRVLTRADYGTFQLSLDKQDLPAYRTMFTHWFWLFQNIKYDFSWIGIILALFGGYALRKKKDFLIFAGIIFIFAGPLFLFLGNMPLTAQTQGVLKRFYVFPEIILVYWIVMGIYWFSQKISIGEFFKSHGNVALPYFFLIFGVIFWFANNYPKINYRHNYIAYDYGHNLLKTLPPDTFFFMEGGDDTFFSLAYLCFSQRLRTDIRLYDRGGVVFRSPYGSDFRRLTKEEKENRRQEVEKNILQMGKTLYYSTFNENILANSALQNVGQGFSLALEGILYKAEQRNPKGLLYKTPKQNVGQGFSLAFYATRGIEDKNFLADYRTRALVPVYPYFRGFWFWEIGKKGDAFQQWEKTFSLGWDVEWVKNNLSFSLTRLGYDAYQKKQISMATALFQKSLEMNPDFGPAYANLGVIYEQKGDIDKAMETYQIGIKSDPRYAPNHYNLAVIYWQKGQWEKVVEELEKTLQLDPEHSEARKFLPQAKRMLIKGRERM